MVALRRRAGLALTRAPSARLRSVLVGFVYPAFQSWKALESAKGGESAKAGGAPSQSQSAWLTYWVVFSLFNVLEHLADVLVSWCAGSAAQLQISVLTAPVHPRCHGCVAGFRSIISRSSRLSSGCRRRRLGCASSVSAPPCLLSPPPHVLALREPGRLGSARALHHAAAA